MAQMKFIPDAAGMDFTLKSPVGTVGRHLYSRALIIKSNAERQVGVKTGKLKTSIRIRQNRTPLGQEVTIGSNLKYALYHHEGTKEHVILPKTVGGKLKFMAGRGGSMRLVITDRVNHPGTRPNRYLSDHLYIAIR